MHSKLRPMQEGADKYGLGVKSQNWSLQSIVDHKLKERWHIGEVVFLPSESADHGKFHPVPPHLNFNP